LESENSKNLDHLNNPQIVSSLFANFRESKKN